MCTEVVIEILPLLWLIVMPADVVIGSSSVVQHDVGVDLLVNVEIVVVTAAMIGLEFIAKVMRAVEPLADAMTSVVPDIGADLDASGLATMKTDLKFTLSAPSENPFLFCRALLSC